MSCKAVLRGRPLLRGCIFRAREGRPRKTVLTGLPHSTRPWEGILASGPSETASGSTANPTPVKTKRLTLRNVAQMVVFALAVKPFMALFIGLRVRGREHLAASAPFILIANHSSHLDTISLLSLFPLGRLRRIRPVAAADYFERNSVVSLVTRTRFNILPIARNNITP